jgi:hypothetical protein
MVKFVQYAGILNVNTLVKLWTTKGNITLMYNITGMGFNLSENNFTCTCPKEQEKQMKNRPA